MDLTKPPLARKLAVRHTKLVCLTASFLATGIVFLNFCGNPGQVPSIAELKKHKYWLKFAFKSHKNEQLESLLPRLQLHF